MSDKFFSDPDNLNPFYHQKSIRERREINERLADLKAEQEKENKILEKMAAAEADDRRRREDRARKSDEKSQKEAQLVAANKAAYEKRQDELYNLKVLLEKVISQINERNYYAAYRNFHPYSNSDSAFLKRVLDPNLYREIDYKETCTTVADNRASINDWFESKKNHDSKVAEAVNKVLAEAEEVQELNQQKLDNELRLGQRITQIVEFKNSLRNLNSANAVLIKRSDHTFMNGINVLVGFWERLGLSTKCDTCGKQLKDGELHLDICPDCDASIDLSGGLQLPLMLEGENLMLKMEVHPETMQIYFTCECPHCHCKKFTLYPESHPVKDLRFWVQDYFKSLRFIKDETGGFVCQEYECFNCNTILQPPSLGKIAQHMHSEIKEHKKRIKASSTQTKEEHDTPEKEKGFWDSIFG